MNIKRIIREEIEDFNWISSEQPNWSDWYQHVFDKINEKLPDKLEEVEEFGSGTLMPILFKIDILNQQFKRFTEENELKLDYDLKWDLIGFYDSMKNIIKAIRNRDDGKNMYDYHHDNETIYQVNLSNIKNTLFGNNKDSIPNQLRSVGL